MRKGKLSLAIIGPGRVGTAIGVLAARAGLKVAAVGGRTAVAARASARAVGHGCKAVDAETAAGMADLVLLTVNDDAIEPLCKHLAGTMAFRTGAIVAHCSGLHGSNILNEAKKNCSCHIGSIHPFGTFPTVKAAIARLAGAYCFIEGDSPAMKAFRILAAALRCKIVKLPAADKTLYHASAVLACNYLAALLDASILLARKAGVKRQVAHAALGPLVRASVDNVLSIGPASALTGPIARGDAGTVARHVRAIRKNAKGLEKLYAVLGQWTVKLALRKGTLARAAAAKIAKLLL
ncbi:MAG: DUF2520 domain-containing protein [Planctomycetes bacterium]|nr:DUF2520 domain-containing protein [Planctomycetota bacterium]